ncbi:MAG: 3-deoxy-7-phosphoheptulonate synthase, partial [Clostridia bacterium]|nr:3-deoxy-7-phosphoheptulonate synthase [Clostridia bacterium]
YNSQGLKNPAIIIDTNHSNSGKNYIEQIRIAHEIVSNMHYSDSIKNIVKGMLIESYIEDGNQKITENVYGKSVTDSCLVWEKTERLIYDIADRL